MTREEILNMAREAECSETFGMDAFQFTVEELARFAAIAYAAGQRDMREAAANCVENADTPDCGGWDASGIAEAIRALKIEGEKE